MAFLNLVSTVSSSLQSMNPFQTPPPPFTGPAVIDVLNTKAALLSLSLPLELVDAIIDYAEYWPRTSAPRVQIVGVHGHSSRDRFITRTLPLGCLQNSPSTNPILTPTYMKRNLAAPVVLPSPSESLESTTTALLTAWAKASQPRNAYPCRKIVFRFRSHDQGWGGEFNDRGSYNGSFTWLDVGRERARAQAVISKPLREDSGEEREGSDVLKSISWGLETLSPCPKLDVADGASKEAVQHAIEFDHPFLPHDKTLQKNRTATDEPVDYTIVWRWDDDIDPDSLGANDLRGIGRGENTGNGEFVRSLQIGDVVTLWARARFPGWINTVEDVEVDLYWAV